MLDWNDQLRTSLIWLGFRTSYDDFAGYRAVVNRLSGFLDLTDSAERPGGGRMVSDAEGIAVRSLLVKESGDYRSCRRLHRMHPAKRCCPRTRQLTRSFRCNVVSCMLPACLLRVKCRAQRRQWAQILRMSLCS
jgi:hypothetical protein